MSSSKSRSRDEARYESKRHRKSEIHKRTNLDDCSENISKEKKGDYNEREKRIHQDNDDYRSDFNRKTREEMYSIDKSNTPETDDNYAGRRKKSKNKKNDKNVRLDKENDYYITNYKKKERTNNELDADMSEGDAADCDKEAERKKKKSAERLYQKDHFDELSAKKKTYYKKDKKKTTYEHSPKQSRYDKNIKESESCKRQSRERYSSSEEGEISENEIHYSNRIRSSVHKIEKKSKNDSLDDEQIDTDNSNYNNDLRIDSSKYKLKQHETEKDKKKNYKEQYQDIYSSAVVDMTDQDKSKRIRSSIHKTVDKSRNNRINEEEKGYIDDGDHYYNDSRTDQSKYKSKRYDTEKERSRQSDKLNEEYSNKRKRDTHSESKRPDRNIDEQRYKEQNNVYRSQKNYEDNLQSKAPSDNTEVVTDSAEPLSKRQKIGNINMRTGGAYIPPARLRMMQESIKDKGSEEYQRIAWEALKKSIVGMTNKVNSSNITEIVPELFKENIIRGRGVLSRAIMQAQAASPTFTRVYAALVAIINTKFPEIGELILKRLIIQYKRGFRRNDKNICMTAARFVAHLLNQEVGHEVLILEMVTHLLENPTEDSVEIAIGTLKECGKKLTQLTPKGMRAITQRVRDVLHEASIDMRVRYMIEVFFAVQKDGFKDFEVIPPELDLVEEEDKYTHLINLDEAVDAQEMLNVFKFDPDYLENEEKYKSVVNEILGDSSDESGNESDDESEGDEEKEENDGSDQKILDMTETNLVCLRRKIYLTIQSSLDFEECAHKLLKLELKPGQILEMCYMILDCCAQQRTYEKFYGLLAQRFCQLNKIYVEPFTEIFDNSYKTIHRLETNKLRNVAKFFAHLLYTDAISWNVLSIIKLNEDDTTSSSRIFIKILFQELCEYMGLLKLNERVKDVTLQEAFEGLFPRDHPHNTRFAINFFTSIGLGGLTDELREHLNNLPKPAAPLVPDVTILSDSSSLNSTSSSSSSSSSSTSSTSSSSSSSDSDSQKKATSKKRKVPQKRKK